MGISLKMKQPCGVLTLDDGSKVDVERIGRGRFTTAWRNSHNVYLQTHEDDSGKEMLASLAKMNRNPHVPDVSYLGYFDGNKPYRLYRAPLYQPLTAQSGKAWVQYKELRNLAMSAWSAALKEQANGYTTPQRFNEHFREMVECSITLPKTIKEAVDQLVNQCYNYGDNFMVEIAKRNCAVDGETLILLDPLFDREKV